MRTLYKGPGKGILSPGQFGPAPNLPSSLQDIKGWSLRSKKANKVIPMIMMMMMMMIMMMIVHFSNSHILMDIAL